MKSLEKGVSALVLASLVQLSWCSQNPVEGIQLEVTNRVDSTLVLRMETETGKVRCLFDPKGYLKIAKTKDSGNNFVDSSAGYYIQVWNTVGSFQTPSKDNTMLRDGTNPDTSKLMAQFWEGYKVNFHSFKDADDAKRGDCQNWWEK